MNFKKLWIKLFVRNSERDEIDLHVAGATVRHTNPFELIEVPRNETDFSEEFINKWVVPFYMTLLPYADDTTVRKFGTAAKEMNIEIVKHLLGDFNWRTRIAGSFFAAINNYKELDDIIGHHLSKSEVCYAGAGYCLALATFASDKAKEHLTTYLNYYLDRKDLWFDQAEAFCALEYLDKSGANNLINKWTSFVSDKENWDLEKSRASFSDSMLMLKKIRQTMNYTKE